MRDATPTRTHCSTLGGTAFAEWMMDAAYISKVPRFVSAIEEMRRRVARSLTGDAAVSTDSRQQWNRQVWMNA